MSTHNIYVFIENCLKMSLIIIKYAPYLCLCGYSGNLYFVTGPVSAART